jgi:NTP pyrophosphatase (non-canonical NTP hydrolase)
MNINDYQAAVADFAIYEHAGTGNDQELMYLGLGLASEAGEVAGKIKKLYRDGVLFNEDVAKELGDCFWYLAMLCRAIGYSADDVLAMNYEKLAARKARDTLEGEGDNR